MATMKTASIKQAKDRLPALVREVEAGERVTITRNGKPVADLVPHRRQGGLDFSVLEDLKKKYGVDRLVEYVSDDFDDPLPEDFLTTPGPH